MAQKKKPGTHKHIHAWYTCTIESYHELANYNMDLHISAIKLSLKNTIKTTAQRNPVLKNRKIQLVLVKVGTSG